MKYDLKCLFFASAMSITSVSFPSVAQADQVLIASEYSVSFAGIPVARSKFRTSIDGEVLSVTGTLATAGIAAAFDSTKATSISKGIITKNGVETQSFELDYKSGKRARNTKVSFRDGNAVDTKITPMREPNPNDVPLQPGQLDGVVDPFFASLVWAVTPADVCNRTIKVFDGVLRLNLVMRASGNEPYAIGNVKGDGIRCAVRYEPVAGHRAKSSSVTYMTQGERATIVFGQLAGTNLYGPIKASIKTKNGTVVIRATKFELAAD